MTARIAAGLALIAAALLLGVPAAGGWLAGFDVPLFRAMALTPASNHALVVAAQFSPDGALLATASSDATVRLWSMADVTLLPADPERFAAWLAKATNLALPPDANAAGK